MGASASGPDPPRFSYDTWSVLLALIVRDDGKVDYGRLQQEWPLPDRFVAELGACSPDSDPARFPTDDDALACWINAYNAFTLQAIAAEYPITSVWKSRDGQFFQRRRHVCGGTALSVDDIEDFEVVYNTYDWGLNDAAREPHLGPIRYHEPVETFHPGDTELRELHLYEGSFCNRACPWCTIHGPPDGWHRPYDAATLDQNDLGSAEPLQVGQQRRQDAGVVAHGHDDGDARHVRPASPSSRNSRRARTVRDTAVYTQMAK